jgi:hypothetical protein
MFQNTVSLVATLIALLIVARLCYTIWEKRKEAHVYEGRGVVVFDDIVCAAGGMRKVKTLSGYRVFSVNNNRPKIVGGDLLVPYGRVVIDVQYIKTGESLSPEDNDEYGRQKVHLNVEHGRRYMLEYNVLTNEYQHKAIS